MSIEDASKGIGTGIGIAAIGVGLGIAFDAIRGLKPKKTKKQFTSPKIPSFKPINYKKRRYW